MRTGGSERPIEILLVEDNPGDVRLTQEAFKEGHVVGNLHVVMDGEDAMAFLRRERGFYNAVRPDLILLDLNLPCKDGREVLKEIKEDPRLRRIPVVVLTTSPMEKDIVHCYEHSANCFIRKPVDLPQFINVVQTIKSFWLTIVVFANE